jgi:hypothetical protein
LCKSRHHRTKPGIIESERQQKRARYRSDAAYRAASLKRSGDYKRTHKAARREERRRARLRKMLAATPGVDVYALVPRMRHAISNASDPLSIAAFVAAKLRQQTDQRDDR